MTYETILTDHSDGILTLTLNRPEKLNAWTYQMAADLTDAIERANADDDVLVVDAGELLESARDMARQMGENPQAALAMVKSLINENFSEGDTDAVQTREREALETCYASAEHKEAIGAFLERSGPRTSRRRGIPPDASSRDAYSRIAQREGIHGL